MAIMMLIEDVRGGRVRGRQRLGWMDGVKVALGGKGMTVEKEGVESPGVYVDDLL